MDIGYIWDEEKYELVQQKHGVHLSEVVSAFEDPNGFEVMDTDPWEVRWIFVGKSYSNRLLQVVYSDEESPLLRLITAFEAGEDWRLEYEGR